MTAKTKKAANGQSKRSGLVEAFTAPVDDGLRRDAMRHLVDYLKSGSSRVSRCEDLLVTQPDDKLGAVYAAARLMQANARVADALSRVAQVEQRRRSVVLHLQDDRPTREELIREIEEENRKSGEDIVARLERRLRRLKEREDYAKELLSQPPSVGRHQITATASLTEDPAAESGRGDAGDES
jgi:ParB-like chromosome segregation protein Spo0J